jgi:iron complex outermembrane receptor protein
VIALCGALVVRPRVASSQNGEPALPPEPAAEAPAEANERRAMPLRSIEEIIVTAQKKEQSLQKVPISVSAFGGELFEDGGVDGLHELAERAPNVFFTSNPCCMVVLIRGFGTPFALSSFDPTVALVLDELLIPREAYMADPLYDLERFEVLRGPQGTLFGKNSPAGLFNVVTAKPTKELDGYLIGQGGNLGTHRFEGAVGGPLGRIAQFRLAGVDSRQPGDVDNTKLKTDVPGAEQRGGRIELAAQPLEGLDWLFIGSVASTESRFHGQAHKFPESSKRFLRRFDPRFEDDGLNHRNSIDLAAPLSRDMHLLQTNLRYAVDRWIPMKHAELVAVLGITGFDVNRALDIDISPADILNQGPSAPFNHDQRSVELRFSGAAPVPLGFGEIELLTGLLLYDSDLLSRTPLRAGKDFDDYLLSAPAFELVTGMPSPGGLGFQDLSAAAAALGVDPLADTRLLEGDGATFLLDQKTTSRSLFGNLAWSPSKRWTFGLGGRLTFEKKDAHLVNSCFTPGVVCRLIGVEEFDIERHRSETDVSPRVTVQYFPFDELALFATRAQGFKSGGFNNFGFTRRYLEVEPEKTVSWEAGVRGKLLDETLSYGATLFNMDVKDLQLQNINAGQIQVRNAASARSRGVEFDFLWLTPWQPLTFRGAGALTDARFRKFPNAPAPHSSPSPEQDLSGRPMPAVPKTQLAFTPEVRVPFASPALPLVGSLLPRDLVLKTSLDVVFRSSQFLDYDLDPVTRQGAYALLNCHVAIVSGDGTWSLGASVENATDADVKEAVIDPPLFPGGFIVLQEFGRRFTVQARVNW